IAKPADMSEFEPIKTAFARLPPGKSMAEVEKGGAGSGGGEATTSVGTPGQPVAAPSTQYREGSGGKGFQAAVPSNWTTLSSKSSIKVVPQNGYGQLNGQTIFSYGVEFGILKPSSRDLTQATNEWLKAVAQQNPELKLAGQQQPAQISHRSALATPLI